MDLTQLTQNEWLEADGLGHVSEIADAEAPHTPRGCPFQAWSLAELLRLDRVVLKTGTAQKISHPDLLRSHLSEYQAP